MRLKSRIYFSSSERMTGLADESIDLIVTSPPYPMISMWDDVFTSMSNEAGVALEQKCGGKAFELMHQSLDLVWSECARVLKPGCVACINIGDATRKLGEEFRLYPNHSRITMGLIEKGLSPLPIIHWFKPTNAPNKFMGSGMLPAGAYVTLEHEYILILRKGGKRGFDTGDEQALRRRSAFFWEERNRWFSDVWDFRGVNQPLSEGSAGRERSGAFPFELPHRLINMYSLQGDTVLDPFLGTGTTLAAAIVNGRGCAGYETDRGLESLIYEQGRAAAASAAGFSGHRLQAHREYIGERTAQRGEPAYINEHYGFPVVTRQERKIVLPHLEHLEEAEDGFNLDYSF